MANSLAFLLLLGILSLVAVVAYFGARHSSYLAAMVSLLQSRFGSDDTDDERTLQYSALGQQLQDLKTSGTPPGDAGVRQQQAISDLLSPRVLYFLDPVAKSLLQAADLGESFEPLLANTLQHLYPSIDPRNLPLQTLRPMARSVQSVLDSLIALELVMEADRQYSLTPKGRDLFQSTQREEAEFRERIWPPLSTRPQCRPGSCVLPIGATDDNASEEPGGKPCHFSIGTDNIYLGECQVGEFITAGFRFRGVDIPARTRVHHAFLQFVSDGPYSNNLNLAIHAEASADSQSFSPSSRPSDRPLTTTYMPWRVPRFEAWSLGQIHSSPDVSAVIQEVLDRPDWTQGNALAIIIRSIAGGDEAAHRRLVGFRRAQANSILQPPRLVIDFAPPDAFA